MAFLPREIHLDFRAESLSRLKAVGPIVGPKIGNALGLRTNRHLTSAESEGRAFIARLATSSRQLETTSDLVIESSGSASIDDAKQAIQCARDRLSEIERQAELVIQAGQK